VELVRIVLALLFALALNAFAIPASVTDAPLGLGEAKWASTDTMPDSDDVLPADEEELETETSNSSMTFQGRPQLHVPALTSVAFRLPLWDAFLVGTDIAPSPEPPRSQI
jgi:hypothetical protein